ncbi:MAG TPA: hypothetical protein DD621_02190 [Clostridiales bacterium]|nr:hypothetical protein [Clostridiales bacterium]
MRKIIDKLTIFGCLVIFLLLTLIASKYIEIFLKLKPNMTKINNSALEIHFVDVGEGDATLVKFSSGKTMLIDAGEKSQSKYLTSYIDKVFFRDYKNKKFDYVVLTHSDSDHTGGMYNILEKYKVDNFIRPKILINGLENYLIDGQVKYDNNEDYVSTISKLYELKNSNKTKVTFAESDNIIDMGNNAYVHILSPLKPYYSTTNDYSTVMTINDNGFSAMLTGDASSEVENMVVNSYDDDVLDVDLLKLGHHGSNTSTSSLFLQATSPRYIVVSASDDNSYNHPSADVLDRIEEYNQDNSNIATLLQTGYLGNIVVYNNGNNNDGYITINNINDYLFLSWWVVVLVLIVVIGVSLFMGDLIGLLNRNKATNIRTFNS